MSGPTGHLVLVTTHYPPSSAAGARRPANLVAHFVGAGWRVSVIASAEAPREWHDGAAGERLHLVPIPRQYRRATAPSPGAGPRPAATPTRRTAKWSGRQGRLRRQVVALQAFPDLWRDTELPMATACREAVGDGHRTLLYSTAPPITAHQAALRVAREVPGLPWVAEYRDPWIEPGTQRLRWSGTIMAPASHLLIRRLVRRPDLHVGVSDGITGWLQRRGAAEVVTALNGIPDRLLRSARKPVEPGVIRYLGEFYLGRDPEPLFATLGRLRAAGELPEGWRLELIGNVESALGTATGELLVRNGLADWTTLSDRIPHDLAVARTASAGLLVLLAQRQPDQIPNKVFEYLGSRRPILAVVDQGGETHRLLASLGVDEFVLTERSTDAEWDRVVAAAVGRSFDPAPWGADPAGLDGLATSRQLGLVEQRCRGLLER